MESKSQTPRTFPLSPPIPHLATLPATQALPSPLALPHPSQQTRPGSPAPSSKGGRSASTAVAALSAMLPSRSRPAKIISSSRSPKTLTVEKVHKRYGTEPDALLSLSEDTIRTLPIELWDSIPPDKLGRLPDDVLAKVSPRTLAKASTGVLMRLPVQVLVRLPFSKLQKLEPAKLAQTNPRWLADFLREVPENSHRLMADHEIVNRLALLPPEEFIRLPHQVLEKMPTEHFRRMPHQIWTTIPPERLMSFPENMRIAYPKGIAGSLDQAEAAARDVEQPARTPLSRAASLPPGTSTPAWSPQPVPVIPQPSPWIPAMTPIAPLAPFLPPTSKPQPPLPPTADRTADIVNSVNGIRLDDLKTERDQLKLELRTEREKLNRQLGSLEAEKAHLEASKSQLETEKRRAADAIRNHLRDKNLGTIDRGQDEVQLLLEYNKDLDRYVSELEHKSDWWQEEYQKLHNQWRAVDEQRLGALRKVEELEREYSRLKQELQDQRSIMKSLDAERQEVARLQTILAKAKATAKADLQQMQDKLTDYYTSHQSQLEEELRTLKVEKLQFERDLDAMESQRKSEQQTLINSFNVQFQNQQEESQSQFQELQRQLHHHYQAQVEEAGKLCDQRLMQQDQLHQQYTSELLERITSLESSLVDNSDDFRPATDDSLRNKYQGIKLAIETITFNLSTITFPRGSRLDPGGFLEREEGKGEEVYLLQSIFWDHLQHGFFSLPFGLGALGPGDGKKRLLDMYVAYRRLSGAEPSGAPPQVVEEECLQVFRTDKEANKWRSSTFQTIATAVISKKGKSASELDMNKHVPYFKNREQVLNSIKSVLGEVCAGMSEDMEETVTELVNMAAELALEFGAQRAELGLETPPGDSSVQIGRGFIDCIDDDTYRDELKTVALAVSPKFYKTGDGRNDLTTTKLISQGTIFSARS